MSNARQSPWLSIRFSLRAFFVAVTAICLWLGYELNWIRQRHDFLARQDQFADDFNDATIDLDYKVPRVEILSRSSPNAGLLWLFGEEHMTSMDVLIVVDEDEIDGTFPIDGYDDVKAAQRLFPEAQIVAAVMPKRDFLRRPPAPPAESEETETATDP